MTTRKMPVSVFEAWCRSRIIAVMEKSRTSVSTEASWKSMQDAEPYQTALRIVGEFHKYELPPLPTRQETR